jgi:hypothetical protein
MSPDPKDPAVPAVPQVADTAPSMLLEPTVFLDALKQEDYQELGRRIKEAHTPDMGTVGHAAEEIGISTSALSRVRSGDLKAAGIGTLKKILDHYKIRYTEQEMLGARNEPNGKSAQVLAYCTYWKCLTCIYVRVPQPEGGWEWAVRPARVHVSPALTAQGGAGFCGECGWPMASVCPSCSRPFTGGLFCTACGSPYVPVPLTDGEFLEKRFAKQGPPESYMDRPGERA